MAVFAALNGSRPGLAAKRAQRLTPDAYLPSPYNCLVEYDEEQHFTTWKQTALSHYPANFEYGFDIAHWLALCKVHWREAEEKGPAGYRKPTKDFPFANGRHAQRAWLDSFRDFLPVLYGLNPTIRVAQFEFDSRIDDLTKLKPLIQSRQFNRR
jgi:hypothetical protein